MTPAFVKMLQAHDWPGNVRELENYMARAVVLANGRVLTPELLAAPGRVERRWRPLKARGSGDLQGLIQQLVRLGVQSLPEGSLNDRIVGGVEREMIEQVLTQCNQVQVTAAKKLGINRNTLHKKVSDYQRAEQAAGPVEPPPAEPESEE